MNRSSLIRLGGLAATAGGVLFLAFPLLGYGLVSFVNPFFHRVEEALLSLMVVALVLVPVGMLGFHALQRQSYGRMELAGFWLIAIASLVVAVGVADYFVWGNFLQEAPPVWLRWGLLGLLVGFVLYEAATLRAGVLPRWCGVAFIFALPVALASSVPLSFASMFGVFGFAWLALGYALWSQRVTPTERPSRVR